MSRWHEHKWGDRVLLYKGTHLRCVFIQTIRWWRWWFPHAMFKHPLWLSWLTGRYYMECFRCRTYWLGKERG